MSGVVGHAWNAVISDPRDLLQFAGVTSGLGLERSISSGLSSPLFRAALREAVYMRLTSGGLRTLPARLFECAPFCNSSEFESISPDVLSVVTDENGQATLFCAGRVYPLIDSSHAPEIVSTLQKQQHILYSEICRMFPENITAINRILRCAIEANALLHQTHGRLPRANSTSGTNG